MGNGPGPYENDPADSSAFGVNVDFATGETYGKAWGENVGWINLDDLTPGKFVSVDPTTVPIDCDMNHNGAVNGLDIQLFTDFLLQSSVPDWRDVCSGDVEAAPDQVINLDDVTNFVACLLM